MKYKEMTVWSAGKKGKTKKVELILGYIIFILWLVMCLMFFTHNLSDVETAPLMSWQHILTGFGLSILTSIVGLMGYALASLSLRAIKRNREITVYLYDFDDFIRLGEVPEGKKVVFSDTRGFVLCDEMYEVEYRDWQGLSDNSLNFYKFKEFYEKYTGYKTEVVIS